MSTTYQVDYERLAALDRAIDELARKLGFLVAEITVSDDRESDWAPKVEIVLRQKDPRI